MESSNAAIFIVPLPPHLNGLCYTTYYWRINGSIDKVGMPKTGTNRYEYRQVPMRMARLAAYNNRPHPEHIVFAVVLMVRIIYSEYLACILSFLLSCINSVRLYLLRSTMFPCLFAFFFFLRTYTRRM